MTCRVVAELSANHNGDLARAISIVDAAARAGAWGVKFQTFTPEQMVSPDLMITGGPWAGRRAIDLYRETQTPRAWHPGLFAHARKLGLVAFSSVFHPDDVDFLETLDCPIYKIASFELTDLALIRHAAKTGKPVVLSTGMADDLDIWHALKTTDWGTVDQREQAPTLLKCTSAYPADASEANLATMVDMARIFKPCPVGLSDHTHGIGVAVAAVALGATMIEKHLTLSRADGGPDAAFSMEPAEFAQLVTECRRAEQAIGKVSYGPTVSEAASQMLRRPPGGKRGAIA